MFQAPYTGVMNLRPVHPLLVSGAAVLKMLRTAVQTNESQLLCVKVRPHIADTEEQGYTREPTQHRGRKKKKKKKAPPRELHQFPLFSWSCDMHLLVC